MPQDQYQKVLILVIGGGVRVLRFCRLGVEAAPRRTKNAHNSGKSRLELYLSLPRSSA
jgi:hypothetical protein